MAVEIGQTRETTDKVEQAQPQVREALQMVLDHVRQEAAKNSQQYLDETKVPHGGE